MTTPLILRPISTDEHHDFIASRSSASFLQTPAWASVKSEWRAESLGWVRDGEIVGVGLVLYRQLPKIKRFLAYLPEGPVIDWIDDDLQAWLEPLTAHLKKKGAFAIRMGPPVVTRRWAADQLKAGIADASVRRLSDLPPCSDPSTVPASSLSSTSSAGSCSRSTEASRPGNRSSTSRSRSSRATKILAPAPRTSCSRR